METGAFLCVRKNSEFSKTKVFVEGGPLTVTEVADDAEIHSFCAGEMCSSLWIASRAD